MSESDVSESDVQSFYSDSDVQNENNSLVPDKRNPPWWHRRSRLERTLCGVTAVSLVMFAAMAVALAVVGYHYQKNLDTRHRLQFPSTADRLVVDGKEDPAQHVGQDTSATGVCLTPGCVKAAATLLTNMDSSIDPCDDFYQFACGGWVSKQIIPDDKSAVSTFSLVQDELDAKLRAMVETKSSPNDPKFVHMMKDMYNSCMNMSAIETASSKPLQEVLKDLGGWPVVEGDSWSEGSFDWMEMLILFRKHGFSHDILLDLSVTPDYRNNTNHIIDLDQTALGMPDRSYLLKGMNDTNVRAYFKLMVDSAVLLGADRSRAQKDMMQALQFEMQLANYSLPREERRNISKMYNKMTVLELTELAPSIDWRRYFNQLLVDPIPDTEPIIVSEPGFVKNFSHLIEKTDKRVMANYMLWRVVGQSFALLNKPWRELAQEYNSVITGKTREEPRWEQCMSSLTGSLGVALASLYVRNHFQEDSKELAMEMVTYIHKEFLKMLEEIDWMDEKTKAKAKEKAHTIKPYIGFPDELLKEENILKVYENLTITRESYFTNAQNLRKWSTDYAFSQLRKPNEKGDWRKHARAAVVNAYYNALENSIEFPAGILQGVFFGKEKPKYLNFGAIGFVIGHEITHGFDDRGRQFDKDGNNKNWWDAGTDLQFRQRAQCIIDQYSNYTVLENKMKINGINTQGENIADNGGVKEAFRAYKEWIRDNGPEKSLPGLHYKPTQLFWISAANVWCGKHRPEVLTLRILSGSHSPPMFRVIGPFSNTEEFAQEFNCPVGSKMNPRKKCQVW